MRRIGLLALLFTVLVPAAAASSTGSLTGFEYGQLSAVRRELKSVNLRTATGLKAAVWDCETIQEASSLLTAERSDCIAQFRFADFPTVVQTVVRACSVYKTVAARFRCITPTYRRLYAVVASFYRSESSIHRIATSRHFTAACTNLLSDPPKVIVEEKRMVTAFASLLAAMRAGDALSAQKASGELLTASAEVQQGQDANTGPLSVCPHQ